MDSNADSNVNTGNSKSMWQCSVRKSVDVWRKVGKYASYGLPVVVVGYLAVAMSIGLYTLIVPTILACYAAIVSVVCSIASVMGLVPWYILYGTLLLVGLVVAIHGYSYAWCIAREFTDEDKKNGEFLYISAGLSIPVFFIAAGVFPPVPDNMDLNNMHAAYCAIIAFVVAILGLVGGPFVWSCYHYYKRTQGLNK